MARLISRWLPWNADRPAAFDVPRRKVATAGIASALVFLSLIAVASYQSIVGFEERMGWVMRSHEVLANIEEVSSSYAQARGAWYGFMATGDELRLELFRNAARRVGTQIDVLEELIEEPEQRVRVAALEQLLRADLSELEALALNRVAPMTGAEAIYDAPALPENIRSLQAALVADERDLLQRRQTESQAAGTFIRAAIVFGYSLCLIVLVISLLYFHREAQARLQAQQEILELNRTLKERAEALQTTNKELEDFSYSVSHDLRAPIRAISSFTHILEEEYGTSLDAEGLRLLAVVRGNAERMGRLIDDLLAFSRVGRQTVSRVPVDMNALVHEVIGTFRIDLREGIRADVQVGALPPTVGDPALLRQVWSNLIDNALKYTSKTAQPVIRIEGTADNGWATYTVADNGPGFDMQYADKLFEVFQRLHHARDFPGTGVGLAIVKRIIDRHNGRLRAEAEPGNGARFSFALPVTDGTHE